MDSKKTAPQKTTAAPGSQGGQQQLAVSGLTSADYVRLNMLGITGC